jgi:ABC-type branched-subunit amino acid transport system substrate-binding protein
MTFVSRCDRGVEPVQRVEDGPWRVGVLFSSSGYTAIVESTQLQGTLVAIDEINTRGGVLGRPIEPVIYDPGSDPCAFARCARRLMVEDRVRTIFGCYTSSSRKAVVPVVERLDGLLWYPTVYEGFECSPNVIYTGAAPNQTCVILCRYLMRQFGTRFFFVGSDYVYPRETNRIMRNLIVENGGSVVGERYLPLWAPRSDFLALLAEVRSAAPDVIFSTVVGEATVYLYQSYADVGFDPKTTPIASITTTEAEISAMGADVGEGHFTASPYFASVTNRTNSELLDKLRARLGEGVCLNAAFEAAYFQVHLFAEALARAGSTHPDILRPFALRSEVEAPQGRVSLDPATGHAALWARIGKANRKGQFDVIFETREPVAADPYLIGTGRGSALCPT